MTGITQLVIWNAREWTRQSQIYHQINLFTDSFTNSCSSTAQFQATRKRNLRAVIFQKSSKNPTGLPRSKPANPCPSQNWSVLPPTLFHKSFHLENSSKLDDSLFGEHYKLGTDLNNILKRSAEAIYDHCYENNQPPLARQNYLTNTSSAHIIGGQ
uniref:Uncharacterized protein n=1 Tax=Kalanchoe fedtschenkoi TaxID=63787 RepID=A0A7N0TJ69_KALFE